MAARNGWWRVLERCAPERRPRGRALPPPGLPRARRVARGPLSEYQWYELVALDRPLMAKQMAELRAISTRADTTPTRFWIEYE